MYLTLKNQLLEPDQRLQFIITLRELNLVIALISHFLPSNHCRVLLHSSLQEAL